MLKKEYDAADGIAKTILEAVEDGSFRQETQCVDGSSRTSVDVKQLGEAVKALKGIEELKRAIAGGRETDPVGVIEIAEREAG
ncbi:MAG: hypothetical protein IJL06_08680 [Kiritimatiellae bacterium]|nr:hypothetical protein [Kiritimatiellia bacterium]